jgi:hypothetical protein
LEVQGASEIDVFEVYLVGEFVGTEEDFVGRGASEGVAEGVED